VNSSLSKGLKLFLPTRIVSVPRGSWVTVSLALGLVSCAQPPVQPELVEPLFITHGVIVGDLGPDRAVLWARGNREADLHLVLTTESEAGTMESLHQGGGITVEDDFTASIQLRDLSPGAGYTYRLWLEEPEGGRSTPVEGGFNTPPAGDVGMPVRFAWSGDLGGQNVCRDLDRGYPILDVVATAEYDFFIGLGDMIYADDICGDYGGFGNAQIPASFGPSIDLEGFRAHWRYNWEDRAFQRLVAGTPYYPLWDDHEVVNNFGPATDRRSRAPYTMDIELMPLGLRAYLDYNPISQEPDDPSRLFRDFSWGRHLDLFFLDTRQYRDPNHYPDAADDPKSMLGVAQKAWLKEGLATSTATWKFVVSGVPLSVPTGLSAERDGWADFDGETGFENELREILEFLRDLGIDNVVFITTDIHYATGFVYYPFEDAPDFLVHEFIVGPMSAGPGFREAVDETFNPRRLYLHGKKAADIDGYDGFMKVMNYGEIEISADGVLQMQVIDGYGDKIHTESFQPHR
jgi:alkaline phosphatase D